MKSPRIDIYHSYPQYISAAALDFGQAKEDPELGTFFNWQRLKDFEGFGGIRLEDWKRLKFPKRLEDLEDKSDPEN